MNGRPWVLVDVGDPALAALIIDVLRDAQLDASRAASDEEREPALVVTTLYERSEGLFPGARELVLLPIADGPTLQSLARRGAMTFVMGRSLTELAHRVRVAIGGLSA